MTATSTPGTDVARPGRGAVAPTEGPYRAPAPGRADLIGFTLTHALFRNELPRVTAALAGPLLPPEHAAAVKDHLRLVTDHLLRHHQEEDEFHWPLLAARAPGASALLAILEAEHARMDPLVVVVRDSSRSQADRADSLGALTTLVLAHLDEEDRSIVPLLAAHISAREQFDSMMRSRAKIPPADELRVLAMMLAAADAAEQARMLAPLPPDVTDMWAEHAAPALTRVHDLLAQLTG